MNDIDMTDKTWTPFNTYCTVFDGQGHTISGITVKETAKDGQNYGLFVKKLSNAHGGRQFGRIKNLTIADSSITVTADTAVTANIGGLAGYSDRANVENVTLKNIDITANGNFAATSYVGGIVGNAAWAAYNSADISISEWMQQYIGCQIDKESSITSDSANVQIGGIVGAFTGETTTTFINCSVAATISGKNKVGGMFGSITSRGRDFTISGCGFYGKITSGTVVGGMVAYTESFGHILNSTVTGSLNGDTVDKFCASAAAGKTVYQSKNSDGTLTVKGDKAISIYCQTRPTAAGHDLRVILLADLPKLDAYKALNVTIAFFQNDNTPIKSMTAPLDGSEAGYKLYKTVIANGETYTSGEDNAIFGQVITDIPNGAYGYFTVSVTDTDNNIVAEGSTKKVENSLEGKTFYFLGSSVTYGSASNGKSMVEFIAERNNCTTVKDAVSGTTLVDNGTDSYVQRLINSTVFDKNAKVDHLIVQLSTNDAANSLPLGSISTSKNLEDFDTSTIIGAMEYIICYAKETWDCEVSFYTGTQYFNDKKVNHYVKMIEALYELSDKWDIGIIDLFFSPAMNSVNYFDYTLYMSDTVHPNVKGYEFWWTPVFEKHLSSYEYN